MLPRHEEWKPTTAGVRSGGSLPFGLCRIPQVRNSKTNLTWLLRNSHRIKVCEGTVRETEKVLNIREQIGTSQHSVGTKNMMVHFLAVKNSIIYHLNHLSVHFSSAALTLWNSIQDAFILLNKLHSFSKSSLPLPKAPGNTIPIFVSMDLTTLAAHKIEPYSSCLFN